MNAMGQFYVPARLTGPSGQSESVHMLVDTGSLFVVLPRPLAERLGVEVRRSVPVITAGGREESRPVGDVWLRIDEREVPTPCFIAPGGPILLGAVALESLLLLVDPLARRLVPTKGLVV
jgi:predicted aspartyl protease